MEIPGQYLVLGLNALFLIPAGVIALVSAAALIKLFGALRRAG